MLQVSKQIKDSRGNLTGLTITADGDTTAEVFEKLAKLQEVFGESHATKGDKHANDLQFRVRQVEENKFYELYCPSMRAKLPYGLGKDGELYPRRVKTDDKGKVVKDENNRSIYLPDRGWRVWNRETQSEE